MAKPEPRSEGDAFRAAFHERMHANNMYGLWELASQMTPNPQPKMIPHMWPWSVTESIVEESARAVPVGDERRALQLFNPGLGGRWATTNNLIAAVQILLPGEVARAHRHTPTAIRFIIEGTGAYTAVDGERVYMAPGDLILTPSWAWHDHGNETKERVIWMDGLDIPLIASLEAMFFQFYSSPQVPASRPPNASKEMYGHAHISPTWVKEKPQSSPLLLYSWDQTWQALNALRDHAGSVHDGVLLEYRHPQTGGPVLPTMACMIQLLRPSEHTKASSHRQRDLPRRARRRFYDYRRPALQLAQGRHPCHSTVGVARAWQFIDERGCGAVFNPGPAGAQRARALLRGRNERERRAPERNLDV
jgi:gentisate 1,2-dioxygenase